MDANTTKPCVRKQTYDDFVLFLSLPRFWPSLVEERQRRLGGSDVLLFNCAAHGGRAASLCPPWTAPGHLVKQPWTTPQNSCQLVFIRGKNLILWLLICGLACLATVARAETKLDFWHSYIHQPSGVLHYSFRIASYKRGLFFGSCGPSTRSLQWEYDIDLAGKGPVYQKDQINITSEGKKIELVSGTLSLTPDTSQATINLRVNLSGADLGFAGNGSHQIKRLK